MSMGDDKYNQKHNISPFSKLLHKFRDYATPHLARFTNTKTLTLLSFVWGLMIIAAGVLSRIVNKNFLWLMVLGILLNTFTDMMDGAVGRYKEEGYVLWGFLMDHMLDFLIVVCMFLALMIYYYERHALIFWMLVTAGTCVQINLVVAFLLTCDQGMDMAACLTPGTCISVDESRLLMIILVIAVMYVPPSIITYIAALTLAVLAMITIMNVYRKQAHASSKDMNTKAKHTIANNVVTTPCTAKPDVITASFTSYAPYS